MCQNKPRDSQRLNWINKVFFHQNLKTSFVRYDVRCTDHSVAHFLLLFRMHTSLVWKYQYLRGNDNLYLTFYFQVNSVLPFIYLLTCGFLVISSCYVSPVEVGVGTAIILSGIPIYYATIYKPIAFLRRISNDINMLCAKFFICMPNEEKFD